MTEEKLAKATFSFLTTYGGLTNWAPEEVDKLEIQEIEKFPEIITECRFYYKRDPIASTVINKLVEIGVTDIIFDKGSISNNEFRIFTGLQDKLVDFMENCALEYLISGLVIPEVKYGAATKEQLQELGIKKYDSLTIPVSMWIRDPKTVKIKDTMVADEPSYFVVLPDELVFFIQNKGMYPDGTKDIQLYAYLLTYYPEFVAQVEAGNKEVLLENNKIIRRKVTTGSPYPTPYLYSVMESLKHKRNIRRMDYSIASRVIEAIQLVQMGNDTYPLLEGEEDQFTDIKDQMAWRGTAGKNMERIFQLFANHTLMITWVYPDVSALLNDSKYKEVNQDIFLGLGFPRILTTGETERTQTSTAEYAMISPEKTMLNMQKQLLKILRTIVREISTLNGFRDTPTVRFEDINLNTLVDFMTMMTALYNTGNISRTTYDAKFGYNWEDEVTKRKEETDKMKEMGIEEFAPQPFSPKPNNNATAPKPDGQNKEPAKSDSPKNE